MEKKKLILTGVAIMALIGVVLGATYAYFVAQTGKGANVNVNIQAGTTDSLRFEVTNNLNIYASLENFAEGKDNLQRSTDLKAILKPNNNTNEARYNYYVYLDISKNELEYTTEENIPELLLKVTKPDGTELTTIEGLEYKSVVNNKGIKTSGFDITTKKELITIANGYEIYANGREITQDWNVEIILVNLGSDQNGNTNKHFEAEAKIQEERILKKVSLKYVGYSSGSNGYYFGFGLPVLISNVIFEKESIVHDDADYVYDFSKNENKSIIAYAVKNNGKVKNEDLYNLYINSSDKIVFTNDSCKDVQYWFAAVNDIAVDWDEVTFGYDMSLFNIEGLENIDTSELYEMDFMFAGLGNLASLDLSSFDTSKVTDMSGMFNGVNSLTELDLSGFDTSHVTDMGSMFQNCNSLTTLDLSNFDTSNVTHMGDMFNNCSSLIELDISNMTFDNIDLTVKWTYSYMFSGVPNNIHIKVKDEAARTFIQARLDEAGITEGVIEIVNK